MKAIKCELCGNNDLIKQDGMFVCQYCGTKYTIEEAKKLIIDVTSPVSITGAVEVTTGNYEKTKRLRNLNTLFELKEWTDFINELNKAICDYPDEWRVWFLGFKYGVLEYVTPITRGVCGIMHTSWRSFENDIVKAKQVCPKEELEDLSQCYIDYFNYLISEIESKSCVILYPNAKRLSTSSYLFENKKWIKYIQKYVYDCENAARIIKNELADYRYRAVILKMDNGTRNFTGEDIYNAEYFDGHSLGKIVFPTFLTSDEFVKQIKEQNPIGGCYVATCVYGSYDCPQVWRLRRFRDFTLAQTWYGRAFISTYYAISPIVVKHFGGTQWFRSFFKHILDNFVNKLKLKGYEDTPYNDKY